MNAESEYRRLQFTIADLLAVMGIVAVLGAASRLPVSLFHALPVFAVLYVVKFRILTFRVQPWLALLLYLVVVAALLPYLYCRITDIWNDDKMAKSVGVPIIVFTVPTVSFLYDTLEHKLPSLKSYAIRSLIEIVVFVPVWNLAWTLIMLFVIGWIAM